MPLLDRRIGTLSCSDTIAARKAEKALDRDIKHNPRQRFARSRGRSCTKSRSNQKRHRSASLSPPMHRTSSHRHHDEHCHTEEDASHQRKRSKSVPSQKKEAANDEDHSDTTNGVEDKEKRWDEVPFLVLTAGAGIFPTLA